MRYSCLLWNLGDMYMRPQEGRRHRRIEAVIRTLDPAVLFVQELFSPDGEPMDGAIHRLADATGMECMMPGSGTTPIYTAVKGNHANLGMGILWRAPLRPVPGSWRVIDPAGFWHALAGLSMQVGSHVIEKFVYHGQPRVGRDVELVERERVREAHKVAAALKGLGMVCGDWNTIGADRNPDGSYFHPDPVFPEGLDEAAKKLAASRLPGIVLRDAGLRSAAACLGKPLGLTSTGHEPPQSMKGTNYGNRLIDEALLTAALAPAVVGHQVVTVVDGQSTAELSDHLPVMVTCDTSKL